MDEPSRLRERSVPPDRWSLRVLLAGLVVALVWTPLQWRCDLAERRTEFSHAARIRDALQAIDGEPGTRTFYLVGGTTRAYFQGTYYAFPDRVIVGTNRERIRHYQDLVGVPVLRDPADFAKLGVTHVLQLQSEAPRR